MNALQGTSEAERRMPPAPRTTVEVLRSRGHTVRVRENRNGGIRYRVDDGREMNALQMRNKFQHYGI